MEPSKWRIAKACQECRVHKTRCSGLDPCQRCVTRGVPCVYRTKARTRMKKSAGVAAAPRPSETAAPPGGSGGGGGGGGGSSSSAVVPEPPRPGTAAGLRPGSEAFLLGDGATPTSSSSLGGRTHGTARTFNNQSVAATHRASPSVFLQLYYGPSSNFSLLNSIFQKMETRRDQERRRRGGGGGENKNADGAEDPDATGVEEIGPGLDLFNNRRLYFGDLASGSGGGGGGGGGGIGIGGGGPGGPGGAAPLLFLDRALAQRLLEHYLNTYWLLVPIWTRRTFRARLGRLYAYGAGDWRPAGPEDPDTAIVLLALALGSSVLGEERTAQYLFGRAKAWEAALDGIVNVQTVQIALLMSIFETEHARPNSAFLMAGAAVRRAVAAGMHKGVVGRGRREGGGGTRQADVPHEDDNNDDDADADDDDAHGAHGAHDDADDDDDDARQAQITIWGLYFWETWLCFSLGRPSAFPQAEMDVPFPAGAAADTGLLQAAVQLARIMAQCAARIYREHHDSLLPMWNAANEIRRDLRAFAEQQSQAMGFGVGDSTQTSELGMSQTILSALYHHTLVLTFRPFVVLRAKLRQTPADAAAALPTPPAWLDTACAYCLDAARHSIAFLARAFELSALCRALRYSGFFLEGASHVMAFELLQQDQAAGRANLPWLRLAIRALNMLGSSGSAPPGRRAAKPQHLPVDVAYNIEQMVRFVYPDFRADPDDGDDGDGPWARPAPAQPALHGLPAAVPAPAPPRAVVPTPAAPAHPPAQPPLQPLRPPPPASSSPSSSSLGPPPPPPPPPPPVLRPNSAAAATALPGQSQGQGQGQGLLAPAAAASIVPPLFYPYTTVSGLDGSGGAASTTQSPSAGGSAAAGLNNADAPGDLSLADLGWNFDFATMDLESFLSIDPNLSLGGPHTFW